MKQTIALILLAILCLLIPLHSFGGAMEEHDSYVVRTGYGDTGTGYVNFTCNPAMDGILHTNADLDICQISFYGADNPLREMRPGDRITLFTVNGRFVVIQATE